MNNEKFRKKIISSIFYLIFFHVSICFLTQTQTSSLAYQLNDLTNKQQALQLEYENLILNHSSKTALINIYPKIKEKNLQQLGQNLDLTTTLSFALMSN